MASAGMLAAASIPAEAMDSLPLIFSDPGVLADFTAAFLSELAVPSERRPTVRCISRPEAIRLIVRLLNEHRTRHRVSASSVLEYLERSRILQALDLEEGEGPKLLAIGTVDPFSLDPLEILHAAVPAGVICYFTALQYYSLTTQNAPHHHIARLAASPSRVVAREAAPRSKVEVESKPSRNRFGRQLFRYQSLPYYLTSRAARGVAATQWRQLNDKSLIHITSREQTLLDTLQRPLSCGGPSVVWEAWEKGLESLNGRAMLYCLRKIADLRLSRRVGYVLESLGYSPDAELVDYFLELHEQLLRSAEVEPTPLLPGLPSVGRDAKWGLDLPAP